MPEIRFTISKDLEKNIQDIVDMLGVDKSDYTKSLILTDFLGNEDD